MRDLNIRWLGKLPYSEAYDLQLGLHRSVSQEDSKDDYLLLLEHNNVITSGRSSKENNLLVSKGQLHELGIEYFETDRGGDITYHGDGQLIGYPIIRLSDPKKVIPFVRNLENVIIDSLRKFKIDSMGNRYAHIINPLSGYPSKTNILSVTVKASSCIEADAYATALHTMSIDEIIEFFDKNQEFSSLVIFENENNQLEELVLNDFY